MIVRRIITENKIKRYSILSDEISFLTLDTFNMSTYHFFMENQHEITDRQPLLKDDGTLSEEGWSRHALLDYDRTKIHASPLRIKEWDYFYILDDSQKIGITFTLSDLGYLGLTAVALLDFKAETVSQYDTMSLFPMGKTGLSSNPGNGKVSFTNKKLHLEYDYQLPQRRIRIDAPGFALSSGESGLRGELILYQDRDMDTMVIATSWKEKRTAFYYNTKVNCMPVHGWIKAGSKKYNFSPETSMGGLDWGRGVWTYKNRWYWGSVSSYINEKPFGFNIGYGFSDRTSASENALFYNGKAHKLDEIVFHMDKKDYLKPWEFTSNDGRLQLDFTPCIDRSSSTNLLFIKSIQHQVFGYFSGEVTLDSGEKLKIDSLLGFAEDVLNWW